MKHPINTVLHWPDHPYDADDRPIDRYTIVKNPSSYYSDEYVVIGTLLPKPRAPEIGDYVSFNSDPSGKTTGQVKARDGDTLWIKLMVPQYTIGNPNYSSRDKSLVTLITAPF